MKEYNLVQKIISKCFRHIGSFIAIHPFYFIIIPTILSFALSTGIFYVEVERDLEFLFSPQNSKAFEARKTIENLFPINTSSNFEMSRSTRAENGAFIICVAKDGGSILRKHIFDEITQINEMVQNLTVESNNKTWKYRNICARDENGCTENVILSLSSKLKDFHKGSFQFRFPVDINMMTYQVTPYVLNLGGVTMDEESYVKEAKAFRLMYYYDINNEQIEEVSLKWEKSLRRKLDEWKFENVEVTRLTFRSVQDELSHFTSKSLYLVGVAVALVFLFSVLTCMTTDWVRSKPWLGLSNVISAAIATTASFGSVAYLNVKYTDVIIALPFLLIGMGMDDSFIMISAWRRTNPKASVKERMSETYGEAATSITITSLTDVLCFSFGILTPFPVVRYFCAYAATAVCFVYIYQITFFGGCMSLSGYREFHRLHPFTFRPVISKRYKCQELSSGNDVEDTFLKIFRDKIGNVLLNARIKFGIIIAFILLFGVAVWSCTNTDEGLDMNDMLHPDSKSLSFMKLNKKYFSDYFSRIHIVINTPLNYADPKIQAKIENMTRKLEDSPYIAKGLMTESWIRFYLLMSEQPMAKILLGAFDLSEKQGFIGGLYNVFLRFPQTKRLSHNIIFNENRTEILASRIFLQTMYDNSKQHQRKVFEHVSKITSESDFPIVFHNHYFIFNEQILAVKSVLIQTVCISGAVVMVTFLAFIPDFVSSILIMINIVLIEIETVGYMSLWNVNIDILSMISLVMCIGFSINYPAHTMYAYITSKKESPNEKMKAALYATGMPIFQGSASTILGVTVLAFVPSYILQLFLKTIFLIVSLTALHSVFILPIFLSILNKYFKIKSKHFQAVETQDND